jgi:predicted peptidase
MSRFRVDTNRIYVTGLSAGGSGTISVGNQAVLRNNVTAILPICAAGFSHPTHDTDFDNVAGNNIEMCMIVGNDDSWKTFGQGLVTRYNAHSPAPTNAAVQRIIASPAGHDENTWNACFQTTFDVYNGTGTANNIYEWMLKNHK